LPSRPGKARGRERTTFRTWRLWLCGKTRRGDLIKLLDTFPAGDAGRGGMDADRLRAPLGLR
jgi:hypothetical protein